METRSDARDVLAKIARSSHQYYELLAPAHSELIHFHEFLWGLPEALKQYFQRKGFEGSSKNVLFRRFVLERTGTRMDAFLQERLNADEFQLWQEQDSYQKELLHRLNQLG